MIPLTRKKGLISIHGYIPYGRYTIEDLSPVVIDPKEYTLLPGLGLVPPGPIMLIPMPLREDEEYDY